MEDCIFCKIINGEIPSEKVYEDEEILAFKDINPAAPVHILVIPKKHIASVNELLPTDAFIIGHIFKVAKKIAIAKDIAESGYRIVNNCGQDGGQSIMHMHFHLLGGRKMMWPAG